MKRKYIAGAVLVASLMEAAFYLYGGRQVPSGQPPLGNITAQGLGEIKDEFNAAKGGARVLLLLSPT